MKKTYNLKVTSNQLYLIQIHIYELCNHRYRYSIKDYTQKELDGFDEYDALRTTIYFKERKLNKSYYIFKNLTEREIRFISDELTHWCRQRADMEPEDRKEYYMAKRVAANVEKVLDVQYQRNRILEQLLK